MIQFLQKHPMQPEGRNLRAEKLLFLSFALLAPVAVFAPRFLAVLPGLCALGIYFACGRPRVFLDKRVLYPALVLAALALFSTIWSIHPLYTLKKAGTAGLTLLLSALLASIAARVPLEKARPYAARLARVFTVAALVLGLEIALGFPFQKLLMHFQMMDDISASHTNRSVVAVLLLSFPVLLGMKNSKVRLALLLALLFMMANTASQSSQLAFAIAALFALAFPYRHKLPYNLLMVLIAALVFAAPLLTIWAFGALGKEINSLPFLGKGSGFGAQRLEIWDFVSRYIAQRPCLGFGMEATRQITDFDNRQLYFNHSTVLHPHNFALQAWIEFGALGAMVVTALIVALLTKLRALPDAARVALPGFMATLSVSAMGYGMWQGWWLGLVVSVAAFNIIFARLAIQGGAGLRQ